MSFKGMLNIYTCEFCKSHIVTKDIDEGVTPFLIGCRNAEAKCNGMMTSSMYRIFDQTMRPDFEWYKPEDVSKVPMQLKTHVANGGLILRKCGEAE